MVWYPIISYCFCRKLHPSIGFREIQRHPNIELRKSQEFLSSWGSGCATGELAGRCPKNCASVLLHSTLAFFLKVQRRGVLQCVVLQIWHAVALFFRAFETYHDHHGGHSQSESLAKDVFAKCRVCSQIRISIFLLGVGVNFLKPAIAPTSWDKAHITMVIYPIVTCDEGIDCQHLILTCLRTSHTNNPGIYADSGQLVMQWENLGEQSKFDGSKPHFLHFLTVHWELYKFERHSNIILLLVSYIYLYIYTHIYIYTCMYVRIFIIVISKLRLEVAPQHKRPGFERAHGSGLLVVCWWFRIRKRQIFGMLIPMD